MTLTGQYNRVGKILHLPPRVQACFRQRCAWPQHIVVLTTTRCQMECPFCCFGERPKNTDLAWPLLKSVMNLAAARGTRAIEFSGGEPTLWEPLEAAIRHASDIGLSVGLVTNGLALTDALKQNTLARCAWVRVSLNAFDHAGSVPLVPRTQGLDLSGSYVWHKDSEGAHLLAAARWCEDHGVCSRVILDAWLDRDGPEAEACARYCSELGNLVLLDEDRGGPTNTCLIGWLKPALGWDGYFYACCAGTTSSRERTIRRRTCHASDMTGFYSQRVEDFGYRCQRCLFTEQNAMLAAMLAPVQHEEFL